MTDVKLLVRNAAEKLCCCDSPESDAYELLKYVFGISRQDVMLNPIRNIEKSDIEKFLSLTEKRAAGYPLQYIIGEWDFYGLTLSVNENVLIPRPETEQLANEACKYLKDKKNKIVFDLCTGSGCIGLSVAANNPTCTVYLFDVSEGAVECASLNVHRLALDNVKILNYDIFHGFDKKILPEPDVILSNPPYVTSDEMRTLQKEVTYEPALALDGGNDGLGFYGVLCSNWLNSLKKDGFFMFESGENQPQKVIELIDGSRFSKKISEDIYGVERFVEGIAVG